MLWQQQHDQQLLRVRGRKGCGRCRGWKAAEQPPQQLSQQLLDLPWRKEHHLSQFLSAAAEDLFGFHSSSVNPQGCDPCQSCLGQCPWAHPCLTPSLTPYLNPCHHLHDCTPLGWWFDPFQTPPCQCRSEGLCVASDWYRCCCLGTGCAHCGGVGGGACGGGD